MALDLKKLIDEKKALLSDGAWGTEMAKKGLEVGDCPELMNIKYPDTIREIAASYIEAGSDIILSNTFGGSPFKLKKMGLEERTEELNEAGARLSREAAGEEALVFCSIGPTGEFMAPLGTVTEDEMIAAFARQAKSFENGGADAVVIETMTAIEEVISAVRAIKENTSLPVVCSMTYDKGVKGYATMMGVKPDDAAKTLEEAGADAVGSNCGSGIENMIEVAKEIRPATTLPVWIKPNAGMPELVDGQTVFRETPEVMAARVQELLDVGAQIVGGCCGSTPAHIAKFREVIDDYLAS